MPRSRRILVIDDDEDILEAVRLTLSERGYEVLVARDGAEGLMRAERDAPDLIVLDVVMPKRSGYNVLERLHRRSARDPRIVVVTGSERPGSRDFVASRGADAFLPKPFDIDELVSTVESLLEE